MTERSLSNCKAGAYVEFGSYYQANDKTKDPIEWLVLDLDKEHKKALLVSRYALDSKQFVEEYDYTSWYCSSLRNWLNKDFINQAFNPQEQALIVNSVISNEPDEESEDKIFLLSAEEASDYFKTEEARRCMGTKYTLLKGAEDDDNYVCCWLRSMGEINDLASCVTSDGEILYCLMVDSKGAAVRPALWVNI